MDFAFGAARASEDELRQRGYWRLVNLITREDLPPAAYAQKRGWNARDTEVELFEPRDL
jgi:hypothetical protein